MQKHITIYSTPTCHFCKAAKEFFAEKNIEYTNYDVSTDAIKRKEMIDLSGQMGVPVIIIDGKIILGFDSKQVAQTLGLQI